jgi:putative sterol carrier protein
VVAYLSDEWMARAREISEDMPPTPGADARLQYVVTGAPDGDVRYVVAVDDGRIVEQRLGDDPGADVTLTVPYDTSVAILRGELDLSAGFMQGTVKIAGNMAKVMALMPAISRPDYAELQSRLAAETDV